LRHAGRSREAWDGNDAGQGEKQQMQPMQSQPNGVAGATTAAGTGVALMAACQEYIRVRQQEGVRVPGVREEPQAVVSEDEEEGQEGVMAAVELRGPARAATAVKIGLVAAAAEANPVLAAGLPGMGSIFEQMSPFQQQMMAIWQQQMAAQAAAAANAATAVSAGNGAGPQGPATPTSPFAGMPPLPM